MIKIYSRFFIMLLLVLHFAFVGCSTTKKEKDPELDAAIEDELSGDTESDGQDVAESDTSESEADGDVEDSSDVGDGSEGEAAANDGESDELQDELAQGGSEEDDLAQEDEVGEQDQADLQGEQQDEGVAENGAPVEEKIDQDLAPAQEPSNTTNEEFGAVVDTPAVELVQVTKIDFLGNQAGGTVLVETSGPAKYTTRNNPENNQFILEIENAVLPKNLKRPYITKDFNSQIGAINAYQSKDSSIARIVVQMKGSDLPIVQAEGNAIMIMPSQGGAEAQEMQVATSAAEGDGGSSDDSSDSVVDSNGYGEGDRASYDVEKAQQDEKLLGAQSLEEFLTGNNQFYGRKISIETGKDADVRDIINFISEQSGANIVISDDVKGTIQMKLRQVPWDQALVILLRTKKLGYVRQGNVIRISTLTQLTEETNASKQVIESRRTLSPVMVRVIPISYASVDDLAKQVSEFLTKSRGSATPDVRTSSLILRDTSETLDKISRLVKELDVPPAQVMIEGKMVEATERFSESFGVNWRFSGAPEKVSEGGGADGADINITTAFASTPTADNIGKGILSLNVGRLDFLGNLDAALALEEEKNNIKVISSPRIMTMNKQEAEITQSGEVFSKKTTENVTTGQSEIEIKRIPYSVKMKVTPQVTSSGSVIMDVHVSREFPGTIDSESKERPIEKREAKTKALIKNGQTAVIGGIFQNDVADSVVGVPLLKDIPILGWLFKSKQKSIEKTELLVFLTPRIMNLKDQIVGENSSEENSSSDDLEL